MIQPDDKKISPQIIHLEGLKEISQEETLLEGPSDEIVRSEKGTQISTSYNCGVPTPPAPKPPTGSQEIENLTKNPWFNPSYLAALAWVLNDLLNVYREIHYNEASAEVLVRQSLFALAKDNATLAKLLMDNQARESMVQAITAFATAGVSAMQAAQTARSMNTATTMTDQEIGDKQTKVNKLELEERGIRVTDENPQELERQLLDAKKTPHVDSKQLEDEKKELKELKDNRNHRIDTWMRNQDQLNQVCGETHKQTINGVSGVMVGTLKTDRGVKEESQKLNEGFMQALHKYSDTTTQQRNEARQNFDKVYETVTRQIEAGFKATHLKG